MGRHALGAAELAVGVVRAQPRPVVVGAEIDILPAVRHHHIVKGHRFHILPHSGQNILLRLSLIAARNIAVQRIRQRDAAGQRHRQRVHRADAGQLIGYGGHDLAVVLGQAVHIVVHLKAGIPHDIHAAGLVGRGVGGDGIQRLAAGLTAAVIRLLGIAAGLAVIDCSGVGYACATTNYTLSQLKKGERAKLYTYLNVREDAMELYGFATQEELNLFQQLISVSGVGPKAALSILSASTPANLALSIITGDEKALTCAQGIGKKIAQRVILELKDKLAKGQTINGAGETYGGTGVTVIPENKLSEASAALAGLGYSQGEINLALKGIDLDALTLEEVIKQALKKMMKG